MESVDGRQLRVARAGHGESLILLHGYPDTLHVWQPLFSRLAARYAVTAFDWPGMGDSEAWPGALSPTDLAHRLRTLLDHWGLQQATVIGADMGGQPALVLAALHPDRVRRVVVMNSLVLGDAPTSPEIAILRRLGLNRLIMAWLPGLVLSRCLRTFLAAGVELPRDVKDDVGRCWYRPEVRSTVARWCGDYEAALPGTAAAVSKDRTTQPAAVG